ncbi:MAG TPA: hypothetical protein VJN71_03935 [Nitrososphaerales archaeon]|nr:hypothetical protein [Nitrososphaerales archaeon]
MEENFDNEVLQCIEDGLLMLGEDGKNVVFWWWETKRNMRKSDIPNHVDEFVGLLEEVFGAGANVVENNLAREIQRAFNLSEGNSSGLIDAVAAAKANSMAK